MRSARNSLPMFVLGGKGQFLVNGNTFQVAASQCIMVELGEIHSIPEVTEDIELIYFGIEQ